MSYLDLHVQTSYRDQIYLLIIGAVWLWFKTTNFKATTGQLSHKPGRVELLAVIVKQMIPVKIGFFLACQQSDGTVLVSAWCVVTVSDGTLPFRCVSLRVISERENFLNRGFQDVRFV